MISIQTTFASFKEDIRSLMDKYAILAPARVDGKLDYVWITDPDQIELCDELPYKSPKEAVFPRVEKILSLTKEGVYDDGEIKPIIIIGVKPCDITSLKVLDEVFTGEKNRFIDPFFKKRRDALILFGTGCIEKKRGCFCNERGIDMSRSSDSDFFLTLEGDKLTLDVTNPDVGDILAFFNGDRAESNPDLSVCSSPALSIDADETEIFETMPWDRYIEGCIGCGTCTYICPTCHCFEFKDVEKDGVVSRYRCWDSCMYPKFTLHASGHNPRSSKRERFRQRVMHKYVYIPKNYELTACTGCGRCIRSCPGGINIRKVVEDINARLAATASEKGRTL